MGSTDGSFCTPWGLHEVVEKIGANVPMGGIFVGRKFIGRIFDLSDTFTDDDLITSRIIRLRGLEPELNRGPGIDSFDRYIYVHGTQREDLIGTKASHGCIRMKNNDIISFFNTVAIGDPLYIGV